MESVKNTSECRSRHFSLSRSRIRLLSLEVALIFTGVLCVAGQECATLQSASPNGLVSYLKGHADRRQNAPCIAFAMKRIAEQRYEPAVPA
jgi:hypothetical protein